MQVAAQQLSGDQAADLKTPTLATVAFGNSLQLPLYRARTGKQSPIHFIEPVYRCVEHEAAGDTDSDPDRAPIELDANRCVIMMTLLRGGQREARTRLRIREAAVRLIDDEGARLEAMRDSLERP